MKKIIHIPRRYTKEHWGGTETVINEVSHQLIKLGMEIKIYTSKALSLQSKETIYGIGVERFEYTYARWGLKNENKKLLDKRGGDLYSFGFFWRLLKDKDIDLIHLHTGNRMGAIVRLVAKIKNIPYGISIHGGVLDIPQKEVDKMVASVKGTFNWGKIIDILIGKEKVLDDAKFIICVSDNEREKLSIKYPKSNVVYIPNGVNNDRFKGIENIKARENLGYSQDDKIILCVGGFYDQKNQLMLLKAFKNIAKKNTSYKLLLVGVIYDDAYYAKIMAYIHKHELSDRVQVLTDLSFDSKELSYAYAASDLFVLASKYETFGIVILEAWAAGIPAICANVGGMGHFVKDEFNSLFFNLESIENLEIKIESLLEDKIMYDRLVVNAQHDVKKYSWTEISKQIQMIYKEASQ